MMRIDWKLLEPSQIEVRPQFLKKDDKTKMTLLLYQDARCAMNALDEQFGEFGWSIEYKSVGNQIYGRLTIKDPVTGEVAWKEDTGSESNIEGAKGQSSDILKRCAVRFGFGRELYSAPKIYVENDGYNCSGYRVSRIAYDENRKIKALEIVNRFGKVVYSMDQENAENRPVSEPSEGKSNQELLKDFCSKQKTKPGMNIPSLKKFFEFYTKKTPTWQGRLQPEVLFNNWIARERN